jgi:uncharacterized protein
LNVGFLINQSVGTSRDFPFELPHIRFDLDLELNSLDGIARVTRIAQGLLVQARMQAIQQTECVRCLTEFEHGLHADFTELYAFTSKSVTDSGLLLPEDGHIDLSPLVREYMLLDVPIKPLCSTDCKGLCPICGESLNETLCGHTPENIDPRLAVLKSLLDEN